MQAGARMRKNRTASRRDVVLYPGSGPPATGLYILLTAPRGACRFCASGDENRTSVRPSSLGVASALSGHRVPRTVRLSEHARTPRELVVRCTPGARGGLRVPPRGGPPFSGVSRALSACYERLATSRTARATRANHWAPVLSVPGSRHPPSGPRSPFDKEESPHIYI